MKRYPLFEGEFASILFVTHDWAADMFELHANLMLATCFKFDFNQTKLVMPTKRFVFEPRDFFTGRCRGRFVKHDHAMSRFVFD